MTSQNCANTLKMEFKSVTKTKKLKIRHSNKVQKITFDTFYLRNDG